MQYNSIKQYHGYDLMFLRAPKVVKLESDVQCLVTKVGTLAVFNLDEEEMEVIRESLPGMKLPESPLFLKITNDSRYFDRFGSGINELPTKGTFNAKLAIMVKGKNGADQPMWSVHQCKVMADLEEQKCIL